LSDLWHTGSVHSRFEVRNRNGDLLGIFPAPISEHADAVRRLIDANPGAEVTPKVTVDDPCRDHPAFEADNCPRCQ
jgi:hypothetical protein